MPETTPQNAPHASALTIPWVGTLLTTLSGLSFLLVCMILPLVGKAAQLTTHAKQNRQAFLAVLLISTVLAALASWAKILRRRVDRSPLPAFSLILLALCVLLLAALFANLLQI